MQDDIWSTLFYVVVMVAVLLAAYYTTKFLSQKTTRMMKSKHIHILDRMSLGKDKALVVAKVGGKYLLIGVTNQTISMLGEVEDLTEEAEPDKPEKNAVSKFAAFLANAKNAPADLQKARMQARRTKAAENGEAAKPADDYLDQISHAINRRKAKNGDSEGMNE